jgi:WhiB family redox-sensing transcriptional regulator
VTTRISPYLAAYAPNTVTPEDWRAQAACRPGSGVDPELFFLTPSDTEGAKKAKVICRQCPVLAECKEWALASRDQGIAGEMTEKERRQYRNRIARKGIGIAPSHPTCGTYSGRWKHKSLNEPTCDQCRLAYNTYMRQKDREKKNADTPSTTRRKRQSTIDSNSMSPIDSGQKKDHRNGNSGSPTTDLSQPGVAS